MNRVYIKTYGCQMNERDSEAVASMLREKGYTILDREEEADVILLNTCSVRDQAEQKAIGKMGYLAKRKRENPNLIIGFMGCMAQNRGATLLDQLPDVDLIVGTQRYHHVPEYLQKLKSQREEGIPKPSSIVDLEEEEGSQNEIKEHLEGSRKVSAFVSIMQGCNMACRFCIVPKTRGSERSRPIPQIVREVEELAARGTREVTLLGQIVTSYGQGVIPRKDGKGAFVQLLEEIEKIEGIDRIRFTSPHPRGFRQDLADAFRRLNKLCECVHLPLQSGSNRILKAMNRPYSREKYLDIVASLRRSVPDMYFSTDIIVGFPGETEEDFQETCDLFEEVGYDMAYIFKYSPRSGTPAAEMEGDLPDEVKEERNQRLLQLLHENSLRRNQSLVGTTQEVLVEGPSRKGDAFMGRTRGNRVVHFPAQDRLIGTLLPIRIERATVSALYGEPVISEGEVSAEVALTSGNSQ
ncbi:MAG: tRNA (N6-isopentenyl adenosine(37)-C2)-methylthiotransferase MiaB [Opitutales bacterium]|nr:tRNA (N6-isopentenyl adenosine(37)-C2)-methylthiotransferase MiaB [Opitutales bacterium]MCH8541649.1 tRNA (N6-isopentenyl adenosine(37)-C2)-methylthiotransferase MiaB [Opitutales bacterium]